MQSPHLLLVFAVLALLPTSSAADLRTIYVIRHGEKNLPWSCLNADGQARANALPTIFNGENSTNHETFEVPKEIFANRYDDPIDCERCIETVTPISKHLGLPINSTFGYPPWIGGNKGGAAAMKEHLAQTSPILTAWEHNNINFLAEDLGVPSSQLPHWSSTDFDTVYVVKFTASSGGVAFSSFHTAHENFTRAHWF